MPYEFLEDGVTADVTFRATAADLDALFTAAAEATVSVMSEAPEAIAARESRTVELEAEQLDMLLFRFLGEIVFHKDADGVLLRPDEVRVRRGEGGWHLAATLRGERLDPRRHLLAADVKAVTLYGLEVRRHGDGWLATVTLDV